MRVILKAFLAITVAVAIIAAVVKLANPAASLPSVRILWLGATNDAAGQVVHDFDVINGPDRMIDGTISAEVFHHPIWYNALPQPPASSNLIQIWPAQSFQLSVPVPSGRAEEGLAQQPVPPGEKWRLRFGYSKPVSPVIAFIRRKLGRQYDGGWEVYSQEFRFADVPANDPKPGSPR